MRDLASALILLVIALAFAAFATLVVGCMQTEGQQIILVDGAHVMLVPQGTKIGKYRTPEEGIFIGKSRIIELQVVPMTPKPQVTPEPRQPKVRANNEVRV